VKLVILFDTPLFFSTASIVYGNVAFEDDVEKAVNNGPVNALKCFLGFTRPTNFSIAGKTIIP